MNFNLQLALEGANNLLFDAVKAKPGERILIVGEQGANSHFDTDVCDVVFAAAKAAGIHALKIICKIGNSANDFPQSLSEAMQCVDHTVFFSRLGDQVRFCPTPGKGSKTMCYVLNAEYLASDFCRTPHSLNQQLHDRLIEKISASNQFKITCSKGTDLSGELLNTTAGYATGDSFTAFEVNLFPKTIFPPLSCSRMYGKLVIRDFLTSSSTIIYDDSVYYLDHPVVATIDSGTITRLDGNREQCNSLEKHFNRVCKIVGGQAMAINSWHTGIIPSTWYDRRAQDDLERWGSISYASPRITHFHACGSDPGQIGINLFDASITFDDLLMFKEGNYLFPNSDECADLFKDYSNWHDVYRHNADLGILT